MESGTRLGRFPPQSPLWSSFPERESAASVCPSVSVKPKAHPREDAAHPGPRRKGGCSQPHHTPHSPASKPGDPLTALLAPSGPRSGCEARPPPPQPQSALPPLCPLTPVPATAGWGSGCGDGKFPINHGLGTSLVVQWLRICLPRRGTGVRFLVQEEPMGLTTTCPEPVLHKRSHRR